MLRNMNLGISLALVLAGWLSGFGGWQLAIAANGQNTDCGQGEAGIQMQSFTPPPPTRRDNVREIIHDVPIVDPYRWLEDQNSTQTRSWIDQQNRYTHSMLDALPIRERIHQRLLQLTTHDSLGAPDERNGYYFFMKRGAGQELSSIYRRKGIDGPDELLVDPLPLSPDHTTSVFISSLTQDGSLLLYGVRRGGQDESELRVLDVNARRDLPDLLPTAWYGPASWKKDKSGFYYMLARREIGKRIYYHAIGTKPTSDREIFGEGYGPEVWIEPLVSEDGRYLLASVDWGWVRSEIYVANLTTAGPFRPIVSGIDARFEADFAGDQLIVKTDWQAPNGRILKIDLRDPRREKWREIVPEAPDAMQGFSLVGEKLFVNYLHNVTTRIAVFSLDGRQHGNLPLPMAVSAGVGGRFGHDEGNLFFSSYTSPPNIYRFSSSTDQRRLWYRDPVPFDSASYETEQIWYSSKDGTRMPMFLVHRKGLHLDGNRPTILNGYGGFNVSITPGFNTTAAWWVEQGGVWAVANIRGGGEFGEAWHRAGMLEKKQNVFDDFIAAAEWLIQNKYTNPERLAIWGGSNGGLLVGAVLTQRPELFRAVMCWDPDLDMVRLYKFTKNNNPPSLLEYGNAADPAQFKFLYAYSPYQHVKEGTRYPAVMILSGDEDTRVPPEQARKMVALLQASSSSGLPIVLLYETKAGHSGGLPWSKRVGEASLELTFLASQLCMK